MKILRLRRVLEKTGMGRSSVWRMVKEGTFPAPIKLSPRMVGWVEEEVNDWLVEKTRIREGSARRPVPQKNLE